MKHLIRIAVLGKCRLVFMHGNEFISYKKALEFYSNATLNSSIYGRNDLCCAWRAKAEFGRTLFPAAHTIIKRKPLMSEIVKHVNYKLLQKKENELECVFSLVLLKLDQGRDMFDEIVEFLDFPR
jgi:hypothetical protein